MFTKSIDMLNKNTHDVKKVQNQAVPETKISDINSGQEVCE